MYTVNVCHLFTTSRWQDIQTDRYTQCQSKQSANSETLNVNQYQESMNSVWLSNPGQMNKILLQNTLQRYVLNWIEMNWIEMNWILLFILFYLRSFSFICIVCTCIAAFWQLFLTINNRPFHRHISTSSTLSFIQLYFLSIVTEFHIT